MSVYENPSPGRALVNVLSINKDGSRGALPSFDTPNIPRDLKGQRTNNAPKLVE